VTGKGSAPSSTEPQRTRRVCVAIDGPAGAGKSTVARGLAKRLGYLLLDTGALYRAVALAARRDALAWDDEAAVGALARKLAAEGAISVEASDTAPTSIHPEEGREGASAERGLMAGVGVTAAAAGGSGMRIRLHGEDVSAAIRLPEISLGASRVSAISAVRTALLDMQRRAGASGGVVVEGRDIGTVVFPAAEAKFFLTASPEVRARRRFEELTARGAAVTLEETLEETLRRDLADTERKVAPLRKAEDAIVVDSSDRPIAEIIEEMARVVAEREGG
jgi:CMP/dCMP kinase